MLPLRKDDFSRVPCSTQSAYPEVRGTTGKRELPTSSPFAPAQLPLVGTPGSPHSTFARDLQVC